MQDAGGILRQPVQKLAATIRFAPGKSAIESYIVHSPSPVQELPRRGSWQGAAETDEGAGQRETF